MLHNDVAQARADLQQAIAHLQRASQALKPHQDDNNIRQARALIPTTTVQAALSYLQKEDRQE